MIALTSRLREAAALVNRINAQKFPVMLTRILGKLHLRNTQIFSDAEREQLCEMFSLNATDMETVLQACAYVFEQAAYHIIRPDVLSEQLHEAGMDDEHCEAISTVWAESATEFVGKLKQQTMSGPLQLSGSQYRLHLMMGESQLSTLQEPTALFQFALGNPEASAAADRVGEELVVEFSHSELYGFFQKLENIQQQLDRLS